MVRARPDRSAPASRRSSGSGGPPGRRARIAAPVALAAGVLAGTWVLTACASGPPVPSDPKLAQGYEVFRIRCASCHGTGGGGGSAPRLIGIADRMTEQQEIDTITNGVEGTAMPAWGESLSPDEIAAVAAYTRTLTAPE